MTISIVINTYIALLNVYSHLKILISTKSPYELDSTLHLSLGQRRQDLAEVTLVGFLQGTVTEQSWHPLL